MKYVAIKVKDFNFWIWFEIKNVKEEGGNGWGSDNHLTSIKMKSSEIIGMIHSECLPS